MSGRNNVHLSNFVTGLVILIACGGAWIVNDYQLRGIRRDLEIKPADVMLEVQQIRNDLEVKPADVLRAVESLAKMIEESRQPPVDNPE